MIYTLLVPRIDIYIIYYTIMFKVFSWAFSKDRNNNPIPLIPGKRPLAVQRLTNVVSGGAVDSADLNAATRFVSVYPASYDCYVYIVETWFAWPASTSSFHRFCPAWKRTDIILPDTENTQKFSIIGEWSVPRFIMEEY